jgi:hypothetical protein
MNASHLLVALKDVGIVQDLVPQVEECYQENLANVARLEAQLLEIDAEQARLDCTRDILDWRRLEHARELRLERIRNWTNRAAIDDLQRDVQEFYDYVSTSDKYAYAQHAVAPAPAAAAHEPTDPLADIWLLPPVEDVETKQAPDEDSKRIVVSDDEDEEDEELAVTRLQPTFSRKRVRDPVAAAVRSIDEQLGLALAPRDDDGPDTKRMRRPPTIVDEPDADEAKGETYEEKCARMVNAIEAEMADDTGENENEDEAPREPVTETYEEHHARMMEVLKRRNLLEDVLATPCYNLRQFCPNKKCGRPYINVQVGGTLASRSFPPFTPLLPLRSRGLLWCTYDTSYRVGDWGKKASERAAW